MATPYPCESELLNTAVKFYKEVFGEAPQKAAAAPGRVNLIGEHTDYNNGFVLPMALPLITIMVGKKNDLNRIRITTDSRNVDRPYFLEFPIPALLNLRPSKPKWGNYIIGVVAKFKEAQVTGFDAVVVSTVPVGGGLSSSAATEVCTYTFLEALTGVNTKDLKKKALVCQSAEHDFAGVPCGIMDQFISTMGEEGSALLIDCKSLEAQPVPMTSTDSIVLIINSNVKHELASGEYGIRRKQCEEAAIILGVDSLRNARKSIVVGSKSQGKLSELQYRRALHVVGEIQRTKDAAAALARSDDETFGKLMYESHEALSKDYEVSCPELDELVTIVKSVPGVYGSRMTGGGFGGCTVTLVKKEAVNTVIETVTKKYSGTPTFYIVRPSAGARQLSLNQSPCCNKC